MPIKVKSIRSVGKMQTYDLHIPEFPVYSSQGLVMHNSGPSLGQALLSLGIDTKDRTIKGDPKTNKGLLEKIEHPIGKMLIDRKSLKTQSDTFISKFTDVDKGHINYNCLRTDTGRLSSGTGDKKGAKKSAKKRNDYFLPLNFQNLTKPGVGYFECEYTGDYINDLHGYRFTYITDDSDKFKSIRISDKKYVEGYSQSVNIRNAVVPPDSSYCLCIDPSTLVTLEDGSLVPLSYLENNPQKILTLEGYHLAKNFTWTGKKQKCRLTLKSGKQVVCSPDHKFKVKTLEGVDIWKPLKDILSSDFVYEL